MGTPIGFALLLSLMAGLSTGIGSLLAIFVRNPGPKFVTLALGFSCGVMVLVSFQELLQDSLATLGYAPAIAAMLGGMVIMLLIDALVPHEFVAEHTENGQVPPSVAAFAESSRRHRHQHHGGSAHSSRLLLLGLVTAIGIAIHNFPEGIATFVGTLSDRTVGIAIAAAIALHNIPEGLAVAAPIYAARGKRGQAFLWGLLSGLAEPVGAGLAALFLAPFLSPILLAYVLAAVAGIMVYIALDELLPAAHEYGQEHLGIIGVMGGMAVMALSLWLLHER